MQFRDRYKDFVKAGAMVFGVSRDNMKSHDDFKAKLELPFELIADTEEKMCHMFGVVKNKIMYGKKVKGIERSTFLIGADGVLRQEWRGLKVLGHVDEVLKALKALKNHFSGVVICPHPELRRLMRKRNRYPTFMLANSPLCIMALCC